MNFEEAKKILDKTIGEEFAFYADFVNESIKKLNLNKDSKILDLGTGWGVVAIILALNGFDVLTGEPEEEAEGEHHGEFCSDWRESAKAVGVGNKIEYQHFDAEGLPFPDESFDAIFMLDTLQHIKDKAMALKECMRVVKPNGIFSVIELNENGVEYCRSELGFVPDLVVPMDFLKNDNEFSVEVIIGKLVNAYILRKQEI